MLVRVVRPGELEAFAGSTNVSSDLGMRLCARGALAEDVPAARAVGKGVLLTQASDRVSVELIEAGDIGIAASGVDRTPGFARAYLQCCEGRKLKK